MEAAQARLSLLFSKCHIVGNHMSRLIYVDVKFKYSSVLKRVRLVAGILKLNHSCCHGGVRQPCVSEQAGLNIAGSLILVFTRQCYISQRIRPQYLNCHANIWRRPFSWDMSFDHLLISAWANLWSAGQAFDV